MGTAGVATDPLDLFLARAEARPDGLAVAEAGQDVTYAALAARAARIARAAAAHGDHPRLLICHPPGADGCAAMFGALMAGGYYAAVNVTSPVARQRLILEQFRPDVVFGGAAARALLDGVADAPPVIDPADLPDAALAAPRPAHRLAYVMFTSGSTGVPKGVMIARAALAHYVRWALDAMAITPDDRWSQHPNIGFDLSVLDIYGALCGGASLHALNPNERRLIPALAIRQHRLTIWNSVPSVVDLMVGGRQMTAANLASLRLMTFCGEPLLPEHLDAIFGARPDLVVHNTYGPTEATVSCTLLRLTAENRHAHCEASVAVGDAIAGMGLHLVGGPGPDEGEIVITGPQLADGYWNSPDKTAEAFRAVATPDGPRRGYYTGDWAERRGGNLFFRSRIDFQTKIQGHRLELDEVNACLRRCGLPFAVATVVGGELHAFVQGKPDAVDVDGVKTAMAAHVDAYAIPRRFHFVDALPRNANDKIDVKALAAALDSGDIA